MKDSEKQINRRNFFKTAGAAGIGSILAGRNIFAEPNEPNAPAQKQEETLPQVPKRKFGKTGVEVPVLGFGTMFNLLENQVLLRKTLQYGAGYWDTADCYAGGNSELGIGKFFKTNPETRKDVFLVTKACSREPEGIEELLQRSLKRMETSYIDLFFLHSVKGGGELKDDIRIWADGAKKRGLIKFFGFSTHINMTECLNAASKLDWIDGILTSYNFRLMQDKQLLDAVEACHQKGIGLAAMKTQALKVKSEPGEAEKAMIEHFTKQGFTEGQAKVKAVLTDQRFANASVGSTNLTYLTMNLAAVLDKTKLTQSDMDVFRKYASASCNGYCAGCANICEQFLPEAAYVSDIMRSLMYYNSYGDKQLARDTFAAIPAQARKKLLIADYKALEARCPQKLPLASLLAEAIDKLA